jgi:cytochrome P450
VGSAARQLVINPVSPENLLDPVPLYEEMRKNAPVFWSDLVQAWFITRNEDVMNCFRDSRLSANRTRFYEAQLRGMDVEVIRELMQSLSHQVGMKDGAEHQRLRRQVNPGFTPQMLDSWRPAIRRIMEMLVDRVEPMGRMDLFLDIAHQLPVLVIAEILGIPAEDRERFQAWVQPIAEFTSPSLGVDVAALARRATASMKEFNAYLLGVIQERRRTPGDDVLSRMIHNQEGGGMSEDELVANVNLILSAGHVTTTDLLSNTVHDLLAHPDQYQKLREDRGLLASAVEEAIRFTPSMPFIHRIAVEDVQLHGKTIRKGDVVFLGLSSANRDPEAFPDPDTFDITRSASPQKNMAFAFGPHYCLGSGLARREVEIALDVLLERLPGLRLDERIPPRVKCHTLLFRGFDSLPVRW